MMKTSTKLIVTGAASLLGIALATGAAYAATGSLTAADAPGRVLQVIGVGLPAGAGRRHRHGCSRQRQWFVRCRGHPDGGGARRCRSGRATSSTDGSHGRRRDQDDHGGQQRANHHGTSHGAPALRLGAAFLPRKHGETMKKTRRTPAPVRRQPRRRARSAGPGVPTHGRALGALPQDDAMPHGVCHHGWASVWVAAASSTSPVRHQP